MSFSKVTFDKDPLLDFISVTLDRDDISCSASAFENNSELIFVNFFASRKCVACLRWNNDSKRIISVTQSKSNDDREFIEQLEGNRKAFREALKATNFTVET